MDLSDFSLGICAIRHKTGQFYVQWAHELQDHSETGLRWSFLATWIYMAKKAKREAGFVKGQAQSQKTCREGGGDSSLILRRPGHVSWDPLVSFHKTLLAWSHFSVAAASGFFHDGLLCLAAWVESLHACLLCLLTGLCFVGLCYTTYPCSSHQIHTMIPKHGKQNRILRNSWNPLGWKQNTLCCLERLQESQPDSSVD